MSWLLGISGTMETICPVSQGLEDDKDNGDKFSYPRQSAHPPLQCKNHDSSGESQVKDLEELIPFSLNPRHSYMVKDKRVKNRIYAKRCLSMQYLSEHTPELEEEAQGFQGPFYKDTEMPDSLSEDEDHSWTCHLPVYQRSRVLQTASMAPRDCYDPFQCSVGKHLGMDAFASWAHASDPYLGYPEGTRGAEPHMLHEEAIGDRKMPSLQVTYDKLREENTMLKGLVRSMQSSLKGQMHTLQRLERRLKASLAKEEREVWELQSFVRLTEWSLQEMTQQALEAESNVEKLKQEILILQRELESSKAENENLRVGQTIELGAVKHNIDFTLQKLHKIITGANCSVRQLASGAESLHFVAEVLKSTSKISQVEAEKEL